MNETLYHETPTVLLRLFRPLFVNKTPKFQLFLIFFYEKVENSIIVLETRRDHFKK